MKKAALFSRVSMLALMALALSACGGGGDVAGDTADFGTNPDEWTVTSATNVCPGGDRLIVTIIGGTPPFRIHNPSPSLVQLDRTEVGGKDPMFTITTLPGCFGGPISILVLDYHSKTTTIDVTVEGADAEVTAVP